ncbi:MAG TPA: hypothetical protein VMV33_17210 [Rhodocyclaceae bacterium]|nr:hypothetical protein [Rhodocyclaceae bacterium]
MARGRISVAFGLALDHALPRAGGGGRAALRNRREMALAADRLCRSDAIGRRRSYRLAAAHRRALEARCYWSDEDEGGGWAA